MRTYRVYKDIRKGAMIWGLPISLFAMMMLSIVASLLIIIFSFSFMVIIGAILGNAALYIGLVKAAKNPHLLSFKKVFPKIISNKKDNILNHVKD